MPPHRRFSHPGLEVQELLQLGSFSTASEACCACGALEQTGPGGYRGVADYGLNDLLDLDTEACLSPESLKQLSAAWCMKQRRGRCEHGRQRNRCRECGGSGICVHGRERYKCTNECETAAAREIQSVSMSVCRSVCLSVSPSVGQVVSLSFCHSVSLSVS